MDAFSYLSVLLSIIIGLSMTQILQGYRGLLLSRSRLRLYAPTIIWSGLLLVFSAQLWWASFGLASHTDWNFATFGTIILQTVLLYMMSGIVLPDVPPDSLLDLREHYFREVAPFFSTGIAMVVVSIAKDWMLDGRLPSRTNLAFHLIFGAFGVLALLNRRPRVHELISLAMIAFIIAYVGLLFAHLGQS